MSVLTKKGVAKEIRRISKAEGDCYICDYPLTETHHIVPVRVLTGIVLRFNEVINKLVMPVIALCPNHHQKLHILMGDRSGDTMTTKHEKDKCADIVNMAEYIDEDIEYADIYNYAVDRVQHSVLNNLEV